MTTEFESLMGSHQGLELTEGEEAGSPVHTSVERLGSEVHPGETDQPPRGLTATVAVGQQRSARRRTRQTPPVSAQPRRSGGPAIGGRGSRNTHCTR